MQFHNRHVIVTGGTGALGAAVVAALLARDAICHVPYRDLTGAEPVAWRGHERVRLIKVGDLSDEHTVDDVFSRIPKPWASLHIAGGFAFGALAEMPIETIRDQLHANLFSAMLCCRAAVRAMRATGEGGRIVNVAARPALEWRQGANMTAYTAAKAGVAALTVALAEEVARDGILVNAVAPSIMDTPANRSAMPKADHSIWPRVEEVAATILFLASPENRVTRGAIVPVYGKS
jgi:NAD(P)-dependent dehydrogenase (short-subunit alcohol dehydrogenase family)